MLTIDQILYATARITGVKEGFISSKKRNGQISSARRVYVMASVHFGFHPTVYMAEINRERSTAYNHKKSKLSILETEQLIDVIAYIKKIGKYKKTRRRHHRVRVP